MRIRRCLTRESLLWRSRAWWRLLRKEEKRNTGCWTNDLRRRTSTTGGGHSPPSWIRRDKRPSKGRPSISLCVSRCGGRKSGARISKLFTKYLREAGYGKEFTFHSLRHTFASHLVQNGVSLYIVSKLLGHSDIKVTEIYSHLSPETFHDAVSLLGAQQPAASTKLSVVHAKQANLDA